MMGMKLNLKQMATKQFFIVLARTFLVLVLLSTSLIGTSLIRTFLMMPGGSSSHKYN